MKMVWFGLFVVWLFGAVGMTGYYAVSDKADCVEREGFIKGLFWCEAEPKTRFGQSAEHTSRFLRGAMWPIHLFSIAADGSKGDEYTCGEFKRDLEYRNRGTGNLKRFDEALSKDDNEPLIKLMWYIQRYYGRAPTSEEAANFADKALQMSSLSCALGDDMLAVDAFLMAASMLARGKEEGGVSDDI